MTAETLLAQLFEELLKTALELQKASKEFFKAFLLLVSFLLKKWGRAFIMFWLDYPRLVKTISPTKKIEVENSHKRSIGLPWGHPPLF